MRKLLCLIACLTGYALAADLDRGQQLYSQLCFVCHGPNLEGGKGPALRDDYWHHGSSPEAILEIINKGVPGSEMIGYAAVFPEADRIAVRDYILSQQEGLREVMRSIYPKEFFQDTKQKLTLDHFTTIESESQRLLPENVYYMDRGVDGILRGHSKLYIREGGEYQFQISKIGRTTVYVNGEEVHYSHQGAPATGQYNKKFQLEPGIHEVEILHDEPRKHSYRLHGKLRHIKSGKSFAINGRSLQGNVPKIIKAAPAAQIIRKWIRDIPPRSLLCLLPNQVIVAYNPVDGQIAKAWHTAEVNQTPSLPDRSARPSEIDGQEITTPANTGIDSQHVQLLHYEINDTDAVIVSKLDGVETKVIISPQGDSSYSITVQ